MLKQLDLSLRPRCFLSTLILKDYKIKKIFLLYTYGSKRNGYADAAKEIISAKKGEIIGEYGCLGFDTYGPFKIIGGIAKGHPSEDEITGAVTFYDSIK